MDWEFILRVLNSFGFNAKFSNWVKIILESAKIYFSVNGHSVGFFNCKRGICQGDPLSPLLFCIAEDVLSRVISHIVQTGDLLPIASPKGFQMPSHVLYADDILIFCRGTRENVQNISNLFSVYGDAPGQLISLAKCKYYAGNIPPSRIQMLAFILGFSASCLPFTYLGVPIFKVKPKRNHLQPIVDRIKTQLASWKGSLLFIMGQVQLV